VEKVTKKVIKTQENILIEKKYIKIEFPRIEIFFEDFRDFAVEF